MTHRKSLQLLFAVAMLVLTSCKKDNPTDPTPSAVIPGETFNSVSEFFSSMVDPVQTFSLDAAAGGTITASNGTSISFLPDCFRFDDGSGVTGQVTISVKEVFSTSQMVFTNVLPVSNGYPLNSGGELYVGAQKNGQEIFLKQWFVMEIEVPAQALDENMILFFDADPAADTVVWEPADSIGGGMVGNWSSAFQFDPVGEEYDITIDSMMWMNCDAFIGYSGLTCNFQLSGMMGLDASNTVAYAVLDNENAVWPLGVVYWGSITDNLVTDTHLGAMPMHIVIISVVDGQLYTGFLPITPSDGTTYEITMAPSTAAALEEALNDLP